MLAVTKGIKTCRVPQRLNKMLKVKDGTLLLIDKILLNKLVYIPADSLLARLSGRYLIYTTCATAFLYIQ